MQNTELQTTLLNNINSLMHTHNISMRQLSSDIGCSGSYIQKLTSKEIELSLDTLTYIAHRFNIPVQSLFDNDVLRSALHREVDTYLVHFSDKQLNAILTLSKSIANKK